MKAIIKKEWIGKRKIHIYLLWKNNYYKFCWIQLLIDGSFSSGFESRTLHFTEYGSAVVHSGSFVEHVQTLPSGNVTIQEVIAPHVTFHSPRIHQRSGIVHYVGSNGKVDEWELDWFPVKRPQLLLCMYSGDITNLEKITKLKGRHEIVALPSNTQCIQMDLIIHPRLSSLIEIHDQNAITNIHGYCPNYIISCQFYKNNLVAPCLYMATDSWISKS